MKAAFRGLRRKASAGDVENQRQAQLAAEAQEERPQVPRLPDLGRASPMPSLRFSGLGLDNFVSNVGLGADASALEMEDELSELGRSSSRPATADAADEENAQARRATGLVVAVAGAPDSRLASQPPSSAPATAGPQQFPRRTSPDQPQQRSQPPPHTQYHLLDVDTAPEAPAMPRSDSLARAAADGGRTRPPRTRTGSKKSDPRQDFHLLSADDAEVDDYGHDDNKGRRRNRIEGSDDGDDRDTHSIEAVRNYQDENEQHASNRQQQPPKPQPARSIRRSLSQPALDQRPRGSRNTATPPVLAQQKTNIPVAAGPPLKSSVSTILGSARSTKLPAPSRSATAPVNREPPTTPSLFAYESGPGSGIKNISKLKTVSGKSSAPSIASAKGSERTTIRNARGEIEWKDAPPMPAPTTGHLSGLAYQHQVYQAQQRGVPVDSIGGDSGSGAGDHQHRLDRARSKSVGRLDKRAESSRKDTWSPSHEVAPLPGSAAKAVSPQIPYKAIGTASSGPAGGSLRSPRSTARDGLRGMAASISSGKLLRMGTRKPRTDRSDDGETIDDSSRDESTIRQPKEDPTEAEERRKAEQWEREREARNAADRHEAAERKKRQEEEEALAKRAAERAQAKKEEKERREREAALAAEQERLAKEKRLAEKAARKEAKERAEREAEERRVREEKEAEERRVREEKEAEERRAQEQKEAEERKARRAEEKRRKREEAERERARQAAEEEARLERERLEAIEAEARAEEEAKQRAIEASEAEARQLADARRQVDEEDRLARQAGRRDARRLKRAQAAGVEVEDLSESDEDADDGSEDGEEVFADAQDMERTGSDLHAPSSVESSADMPVTPADEAIDAMHGEKWKQAASQGAGPDSTATTPVEEQDKALKARDANAYRSDRFRAAVMGGARKAAPDSTPLATPALEGAAHEVDGGDDGDDQIVQPNGPYREGGITYGRGWCSHGLADPTLLVSHRRIVRTLRPPATKEEKETPRKGEDDDAAADAPTEDTAAAPEPEHSQMQEPTEPAEPEYDEAIYSDLGELIWSSTTPDVIARLVSHLDYADVKALRQTSQSIRFALGQLAGREIVLSRFLGQVGYQSWKSTWTHSEGDDALVVKDPLPLSFSDCEAFLLSYDLLPEYRLVGAEYAKAPHKVDPRYPRLARATTRSYNRVLARLRMQPTFVLPSAQPASSQLSPLATQGTFGQAGATHTPERSPALGAKATFAGDEASWSMPRITSPWKPGRAALFRVWVPSCEEGGWLSDAELSRCERELFIAGVWSFLKRGDVVWDCAIGDERNVGKYMFDGRYLRDLSFMFDRTGHLPSWINAFSYAPSYYHNIIRSSSSAQPIVYLDVLPWRDQIVSTMRLVQDQVETFNPQGARYRISKWLYRAVFNVTPGQIISDEGLEVVDAGWHGRIVIETEGTAEHAKELISRCAGPAESAQTKARLLASVMDADGQPRIPKAPAPTRDASGQKIETTTPWAVIRARSRPGMIWIRPIDMRERVTF
ncbi:uncharacterized protein PFL1_01014 [Pseudozyma flocculosa PF-1]|uniref:Uncharacterized protein n=1 Tax=Pseudozyma flocculosa TaxID=84751 RepID=A0A5C3F8N2_9BASI|nr:uncharacterized protein PFL1_01014 [Pseudozyma flocculosa PF-1]EPQ31681.1 hypothetical protein PFL1_01014 [Pseudozyma flocculosa PF-1]SPO40798.1 uncharacterized protein PSFLO_06280 [Pseudozyma flocculosa]